MQKIPGAGAFPGVGFTTQTVLLLTAGAMAVGWPGELALGPRNARDPDEAPGMHTKVPSASSITETSVVDPNAALSEIPVVPMLEAGTMVDTPRRAERQVEIAIRRAIER